MYSNKLTYKLDETLHIFLILATVRYEEGIYESFKILCFGVLSADGALTAQSNYDPPYMLRDRNEA